MTTIGAVIVTYNRLEKLKKALAAYASQTVQPQYILVVNNHSSDGTEEYLDQWTKESSGYLRWAVHLEENTGGSGGFYAGLEKALNMPSDWIWLGDDDAYPEPDCFQKAVQFLENTPFPKAAAVCGKVITNGHIDTWHRRSLTRKFGFLYERQIPAGQYTQPFEINFLSYVGSLLNREALQAAGLPERDFFIAYDDSEHSIRLNQRGKIICLPDIAVWHDTTEPIDGKRSWKRYYSMRNKLYSYKKHYGKTQAFLLSCYYLLKNIQDPVLWRLTAAAVTDAYRGRLGIHPKYYPGWKG